MALKPLEYYKNVPDIFYSYRYLVSHSEVQRVNGGWRYKGQFYPDYLTVGGACFAIFDKAKEFCVGKGVDIGAGYWPFPGATPIDIGRGVGLHNSIDKVQDKSLDYIFSSHCLEHITDWKEALLLWRSKLKSGGILFLYLPHPNCGIWHPKSPFVGDGHVWIPTETIIKEYLLSNDFVLVKSSNREDFMRSFYICVKKK